MKRIMLATDFSERSDRALRRASLLARQFNASLSIIHVVDDDQPRRIVDSKHEAATALLAELEATVREVDAIECQSRVVLADPFAGIAQVAAQDAPDLLVLGSHRRKVLRDVFVGTTAERTIRTVSCPVLMVNAPPVGPYRRVLLTTDLSSGAEHAARTCATLGILQGADVSILHVFDSPVMHLAMTRTMSTEEYEDFIKDLRSNAALQLSAFCQKTGWHAIREVLRRTESVPAAEILTAAKDDSAELIVMGTHGRSSMASFFLGSVAAAVLSGADRDVIVVPGASSV